MAIAKPFAFCLLLALTASHLQQTHAALFKETFDADWDKRWIHSTADKYNGRFVADKPESGFDVGLKVPEKAKHYGIAALVDAPVDPSNDLVLQYEVKYAEGHTCGGGYLKFLTEVEGFQASGLRDDTPYTIMFGPDKCGGTNKVHLIFRHQNPKTGTIEEKHLKFPPSVPADKKTHVYTAVLRSNNTYDVLVDGKSRKSGSLFEDFQPPFNPPAEIDDPEDSKPADWVEEAKITDPDATKPDDWDEDAPKEIPDEDAEKPAGWLDDEPSEIDDPDATAPEDWDEEEDGTWEAPKIANPKCKAAPGCGEWTRPVKANPAYKGKWKAPLIDNPEYKGPWAPRKIPNPEFYEDPAPLTHIGKIGAVAMEIWTMDSGIFIDDVVITTDPEEAKSLREALWRKKSDWEDEAERKEAQKEKLKQEAADNSELHSWLSSHIKKVLHHPALEFAAPVVDVLEQGLDKYEVLAYVYIAAPILLLLLTVSLLIGGGSKSKRAAAAAQAKKEDITTADDEGEQEEEPTEEEIQEQPAAEQAEEEEEEEEEEVPAKPTTRRRTRRDT